MNTLIFNWRDELIRIKPDDIVYFEADGNYTNMMLASKKQQLLSMNLSKVMSKLVEVLGSQSDIFERVGRDLIIRKPCLYSIHLIKKQLILTVPGTHLFFELQVSKDALKKLKENQQIKQFKLVCEIQLRDLQTLNTYVLKTGLNHFGRKSSALNCEHLIDNGDNQMSRRHFCIRISTENMGEKYNYDIIDLGSSNGTYLNDKLISMNEFEAIEVGAKIRAGKTVFRVELVDLDKTIMP